MKFDYYSVGRIIVERGGSGRLPELLAGLNANRVLLITNAPILADNISLRLKSSGIAVDCFQQNGEPTIDSVRAAVVRAGEVSAGALIALGGGSAIDCAKAASGIITNGGEPLDYMEVIGRGKKIQLPGLPWIAIPTTAGTGAEATRNAVVGCAEKKFKASIRSEHLLPRIALIDATLAVDLPPEVTAASGADALCQLIESYTCVNANPITDGLAVEGISRAVRSLRNAYDTPGDLVAREDMAIAALLSGMTLSNAGLGAVHGFAAPIGGRYPIPHGAVCAVLLPLVIQANINALRQQQPKSPALTRYATIGRIFNPGRLLTDEQAADSAIADIKALISHMQIPPLNRYGLAPDSIPDIVQSAMKSSSMKYNPIQLSPDDLADILHKAIGESCR